MVTASANPPKSTSGDSLDVAIDRLTSDAARRAGLERVEPRAPPFRRIVVGVDGSSASEHALEWARELARMHGAQVTLVTVLMPPYVYEQPAGAYGWWVPVAEAYDREREQAHRSLNQAVATLTDASVPVERRVEVGTPVREITRIADELGADLVILGSHGRKGMSRVLLGSVADGVKNHTNASVLIAKSAPPPGRILVATDGSTPSKAAARVATRLARSFGSPITLLHVREAPFDAEGLVDRFQVDATVRGLDLKAEGVDVAFALDVGRPAQAIVRAAQERGSGLVVMGSRGLGAVSGLVVGSVSNRVSHESPVSVLIVKEAIP